MGKMNGGLVARRVGAGGPGENDQPHGPPDADILPMWGLGGDMAGGAGARGCPRGRHDRGLVVSNRDAGPAAGVPGSAGAVSPAAVKNLLDGGGECGGRGGGRGAPDALQVAEGPPDGRAPDEGAAGAVQEAGPFFDKTDDASTEVQ